MSYEWVDSNAAVGDSDNTIHTASFQNSSFQRRGRGGGGGGFRGNPNMNRFDRGNNDRRGGGAGGGGARFNRNDRGNGSNFASRNSDAKIIKIPTKFVGRVIGKGGSKINDLQFESGAKIIVTKEEENNETIVKLIGSNEAVERAEELIRDLTVERDSYRSAPVEISYDDSSSSSRSKFL